MKQQHQAPTVSSSAQSPAIPPLPQGRDQLKWQILETDEPAVLAHWCESETQTLLALHNLADRPCAVTLQGVQNRQLVEVFGDDFSHRNDRHYEPLDPQTNTIPLHAFGYRWLGVSHR